MKKQTSMFKTPRKNTKKWWVEVEKVFGGSIDYRKCARPFDSKSAIHTVFKAHLGHGIWFTKSQRSIEKLLRSVAYRYGVTIKEFSIQKDHIHVLVYLTKTAGGDARKRFENFLRLFSCEMGRKYKKIFHSFGVKKSKSLWVHRPFTRMVSWGKRSILNVVKYIHKNDWESMGFVQYLPRSHRLNEFLRKWAEKYGSG